MPRVNEKKTFVDENLAAVRNNNNAITHVPLLYDEYKQFLTRYSLPFAHDRFYQTPVIIIIIIL